MQQCLTKNTGRKRAHNARYYDESTLQCVPTHPSLITKPAYSAPYITIYTGYISYTHAQYVHALKVHSACNARSNAHIRIDKSINHNCHNCSRRRTALTTCHCKPPAAVKINISSYTVYHFIIMRPSSLGGGRILRRTLSVCPSVCPSVPFAEVVLLFLFTFFTVEPSYERTSKIEKTSVFAYGPASRMYFSARREGRISYGHLGRTNLYFTYCSNTNPVKQSDDGALLVMSIQVVTVM